MLLSGLHCEMMCFAAEIAILFVICGDSYATKRVETASFMDVSAVRKQFEIPGILRFDQDHGMTRLRVTAPDAEAVMYMQGAHLTHWQPACQDPVIFLSRTSEFAPGKAIRGGVPIVFPWFATDSKKDRINGHPGPSHGFARLQDWELVSAERAGGGVRLKLTLGPTELSRAMGYDGFLLTLEASVGRTLGMRLTVQNTGAAPLQFEEAFHNYFRVVDVHEASVSGLEPTGYIDKIDGFKQKPATGEPIRFVGPTDRVYLDTVAPCTIHDGTQRRDIRIVKANSRNTVVWNPGKAVDQIDEWDWHEMMCVETANVGANAHTLAPGESFTMGQTISVRKWAGSAGCANVAPKASARSPRGTG